MASAPVLSTAQTDENFTFDKVESIAKDRFYLGHYDESELQEILHDYYSIDELVDCLKGKYSKITLQFPDELVCDSSYVVQMLQNRLNDGTSVIAEARNCDNSTTLKEAKCNSSGNCSCNRKSSETNTNGVSVWALADTSYSPCCVDEVAAEHVGADVVVHFGDSCFTPIEKLPAVFVLGKPSIDFEDVVQNFKKSFSKDDKVVLMADASYSRHLYPLWNSLKEEGYTSLGFADIAADGLDVVGYPKNVHVGMSFGNRVLINCDDPQDYKLFHITQPKPPRLLYLSTKFESVTVYDAKSKEIISGPFPNLMKRYRYMHLARSAGTIGILVNTLSLQNTNSMIDMVAKWISDAGKKYYMFVVGKPNVAKLANFDAIDVWCILGCGQSGMILDENRDYYKPIVTPYELHLALSQEISWSGKWVLEFKEIMALDKDVEEGSEDTNQQEDDEYVPEFNAVTGKLQSNSRPLRQIKHLQIEASSTEAPGNESEQTTQLVKQFSKNVVIKDDVSTSALYLQQREWKGLGSDFQNEEIDEDGANVEEGRAGIARGYDK